MKRAILLLVFVCCATSVAHSAQNSGAAQGQTADSPRAPNLRRMETIIRSYVDKKQFMGSVLVARGDNILLDKGYGFANLEWNIPNSPKTKFRLGSLTKQFTAASILLLGERGKLNVNDPVKKYMPDAPAAWDKITIYNLLTHTSGIPDFIGFADYASLEPFAATPEQVVALFRDKPLEFQPGEDWNYSNSGYILLGYLLEKISGEKFERFVEENIFTPLGMADSGYDSNSAVMQNRASGYTPESGGRLVNARYISMTIPFAAGGLYSTTEDLLRWEQGLLGGKLLSSASLKQMLTPFKNDYAFGLVVRMENGHQVIDHGGRIPGFDTALVYYPEDKLTVVVLANTDADVAPEIAIDLGTLAHGDNVVLTSERKEIHIDPKIFDAYVGSYQLAPKFILTVTRDGDHFMMQATGQRQVEIFPESDHGFFARVIDAQITVVTDSQGHATELILHQHGDHHAPRVEQNF